MVVFDKKDLKKGSFLNRILKRKIKENALIELNNLFAEKDLSMIRFEEISEICFNYQIDLKKEFRTQLYDVYERHLTHYLNDSKLSEAEIKSLQHLKKLLQLNDQDIQAMHQAVAGEIYKQEVEKALQDDKLSKKEAAFLKRLQQDLRLTDDYAADIYKESATQRIKKLLRQVVADERLSPEEEQELAAIGKNLNIELQFCEKTKAHLEKCKLFWQIENGDLPQISVRINLQKNEKCSFHTGCDWFEQRRVVKRFNYSGPTLRFKIVKGVYWRAGSLQPQVISQDQWQLIDRGELYVTNKRMIFLGSKGNKTIKIERILDFSVYSNGAEIQKDRGKSPFIVFNNNNDLFSIILGRVISMQ